MLEHHQSSVEGAKGGVGQIPLVFANEENGTKKCHHLPQVTGETGLHPTLFLSFYLANVFSVTLLKVFKLLFKLSFYLLTFTVLELNSEKNFKTLISTCFISSPQ